jgi:hypothetical protein
MSHWIRKEFDRVRGRAEPPAGGGIPGVPHLGKRIMSSLLLESVLRPLLRLLLLLPGLLPGGLAQARGHGEDGVAVYVASTAPLDDGIEFRYRDREYERVYLVGDFNGWSSQPMLLDGEEWVLYLVLPPGHYLYRFEVYDGDDRFEAIDPDNQLMVKDADHGWASQLDVDEEGVATLRGQEEEEEEEEEGQRSWWQGFRSSRAGRCARLELRDTPGRDGVWFDYQRVDGFSLGAGWKHVGGGGLQPSSHLYASYGFLRNAWTAGFTVLQPLIGDTPLWLRLSVHAGTDYMDRTGVGDLENTLAAIFTAHDYRDYYERNGGRLSLLFRPFDRWRLEGGAAGASYHSLPRSADWSWGRGDLPPNPEIDEGEMRSIFGRAHLGFWIFGFDLEYEHSLPDLLGSEFDFAAVTAEHHTRISLGASQYLHLRVKGSDTPAGTLPRQRRALLGGFGTVRGYPYQSLLIPLDPERPPAGGGERMLLANADYTFAAADDVTFSLLYDTGMVWESAAQPFDLAQLKSSAGVGLAVDEGDIRFNVMQALDGTRRDPVWEIRISKSF